MAEPDASLLANALGYVLGAGSLLLYTPIAVRVVRQGSADGLTLSTWWLKLASYTCTDVYAFTHEYPLSTYIETLIITVEATVILLLVSHFQRRMDTTEFVGLATLYVLTTTWALTAATPEMIAFGQVGAAALNTGALVPQFLLNAARRSKGDYSPVTAALAGGGCMIRLFTTMQLADSDPILLGSFGIAFLLNTALFAQIMWYGVVVEGLSPGAVLSSDLGSTDGDGQKQMELSTETEPLN